MENDIIITVESRSGQGKTTICELIGEALSKVGFDCKYVPIHPGEPFGEERNDTRERRIDSIKERNNIIITESNRKYWHQQ